MLRVALTGGIGTGKTVVLGRFQELGAPVIEADVLAREALAPGTPGVRAVADRFGPGVIGADGRVDRRALGALVFADDRARRDLEAIVHPDVRRRLDTWMAERTAAGAAVAIVEIPLLFETGRERDFDVVLVTACDEDEQVRRVMARDGLSEPDVRRRLAAQLPIAEKVRRADHVIRTDGRREDTLARVDAVWRALVEQAAEGRSAR